MSNTIPNISGIDLQNKQLNTFHTPSFGDEDFDITPLPVNHHIQQQHSQQMDHYQIQQQDAHHLGNIMDDTQYLWQQDTQQLYMDNSNNYEPQLQTHTNSVNQVPYGNYGAEQIHQNQHHHQQQHQQLQHQQHQQIHQQQLQQQQQQQIQQQQLHQQQHQQQQQQQQQQQMLMMPPPYKSPSMTSQQVMSSPTGYIGQSPVSYGGGENGTTSEDSDDSGLRGGLVNPLKRPSPEPPSSSPTKAVKATATNAATKKPKVQRKKKKKDPNEPQKPVSAYALFFRDTQAAIKGQNPNASFGEVSTIVASMWDVLAPEHKDVYKKKTEAAKKEYLKTLAAYRASIVSKGNDVDNSLQQQGAISPQQVPQVQGLPLQQNLPQSPISHQNNSQQYMQQPQQQQQQQPYQSSPQQQPHQQQQQPAPPPLPPQNQQQQQQHQQQSIHNTPYQQQFVSNSYKSPTSNQIEYNNINMQQQSMQPQQPQSQQHLQQQLHQQQQQQQQQQQLHQQQQIAIVRPMNTNNTQNYGYDQSPQSQPQAQSQHNIMQMDPYSLHHHQNQSGAAHQPPQNIGNGEHLGSPTYINASPNQNVFNNNNNSHSHQQHQQGIPPPHQPQLPQQQQIQQCIRHGCTNQATVNPDWEDEYCSNECVITHCRDVFSNWIQTNAQSHPQQTYSVVK